MAAAARLAGKLEAADRYTAESREIAERLGLRALLRELRSGVATGAWLAGDPDAALAIMSEVRDESVGDGDGQRLVYVERRSGEILESEGRYEEAVVAWTAALAASHRT